MFSYFWGALILDTFYVQKPFFLRKLYPESSHGLTFILPSLKIFFKNCKKIPLHLVFLCFVKIQVSFLKHTRKTNGLAFLMVYLNETVEK